jgi:glycogen operon protein
VDDPSPFDWGDDAPPAVPWDRMVIYEAHVKGATALHPDIAPALRGTFAGLASAPFVDHLRRLGVTTIELLPVHAHADEPALVRRGLSNYWGYNTLAFFAPDPRFAAGDRLGVAREFKSMVRTLHAAGLEVILDVVYNHTAEGDHLGPTLAWRGLDNAASYRLRPEQPSRYENVTGTGNALDLRQPSVLALVIDSLRHWVTAMHVDGFRFDLAPVLIRGDAGPDMSASFLAAIAADPVLSRVKLIAEPWDAAPDGYTLGAWPAAWSEWNDRYRDAVRRFWRGDAGLLPELATRLAGSRDLFDTRGRSPRASVNYVTSHDGFTLADVVSYSHKHNDANGEDNADGHDDNVSANHGVEGPTADPAIAALRARQQRNVLLTLAVSQGVPMLSGGDEVGRTQLGNNNAYCHDSPLTWTHWTAPAADWAVGAFAARVLALRAAHPVLRRTTFFDGDGAAPDVVWLGPDGRALTAADWQQIDRRTLGMLLSAEALADAPGAATLLVLFNAATEPVAFHLPDGAPWELVVDTTSPDLPAVVAPAGTAYPMAAHSAAMLGRLQS